jgi:hypothetical protein
LCGIKWYTGVLFLFILLVLKLPSLHATAMLLVVKYVFNQTLRLFYMFWAYMPIIRDHCLNYITILLVAIQIY